MKYFPTFSGAGGFEIALEDHECVAYYKLCGNDVASKVVGYLIRYL